MSQNDNGTPWPAILCWRCRTTVAALTSGEAEHVTYHHCDRCGAITICRSGVWRCIPPRLLEGYERFIREYEFIRAAEGRGSSNAAYYLALPYHELSGKMTAQWKIRARTFDFLKRDIVNVIAAQQPEQLQILDLGAGNGWLCYRLALLGHAPTAVDLLTNNCDGLGAAAHYAPHLHTMFPRVQAVLDHLPFSSASFDLAIFNASFHYSQDYARTLAETIRCLRPRGTVVIADTPWYARQESGAKMVEEKHASFQKLYGFPSNSIPSQEFLTPAHLDRLAVEFNLRWTTHRPYYGIGWSLRPLRARLRGLRPPSRFHIYVAQVAA